MRTFVLAVCLAAAALPAGAQDDPTLIGIGVRSRPDYDGARTRTVDLVPVLRWYGKPLFARTTQGVLEGGARLEVAPGVNAGVQLGYEQGPRDEHPDGSYGVHLELDGRIGPSPITLLARLRRYMKGDHGSQADLRFTAGVLQGGPALGFVFTQVTFANAENVRAFFGISESGYLYADFGLLGSYDVAQNWALVGSLYLRRLDSDIARQSMFGNRQSNVYATAGVAYKF
jgi:outer membrane scaffolding protein for murein synthesis (MipA/OmpV family)